jgi:hypothetical protein
MKHGAVSDPPWLETTARVTSCKYRFARMNALTLGIPTDRNRFLIGYTYYAHGRDFTGEFTSPTYIEQGHSFILSYNPLNPQQNSKSTAPFAGRGPLFALGIAGSVILSLLYFAMLRGCN